MKIFLILATLFIAGCSDTYRYPCQDPYNWDKEFCKKPFCSANGTCPENLKHYEKEKPGAASATPAPTTGVCK